MPGKWKMDGARRSAQLLGALSTAGVLVLAVLSAAPATAAAQESVAERTTVSTAASSLRSGVRMADLSRFQPGNIISDAAFFNSNTMSAAQIQSFLEAKVPSCDSGYVCLKDWYDTSRTTTADAMCGPYAGGYRERASTIIYRVAQACGINPQVIIATLEKEQGLVTHVWPSEWRYTIAMGQGCPDTAACDTRYYGFFNQVYGAAWQFKRYANPPGTSQYFTWYAPGRTWNVRYNPDAGCGSSPVYIQNQATANLYYYTPYQPNAAALAAGRGTGDGCSAYGNRNFYNNFTDWFGSSQRDPAAEIEAEYQAQGGLAGLGAAQSGVLTISANGGGYARAYAGGSIYWTTSSGAKTVRPGPVRDYYFARSGADGDMGWPSSNEQQISAASGAGTGQAFTAGSVYSSRFGTFIVRDPLRAAYFATGGALGSYGWPTGDQSCMAGTCTQPFESASVVSSSAGVFGVTEPVRTGFTATGGASGEWGPPVSAVISIPENGGGYGQAFAKGSVYYRPGGSAFFVSGAVRDHYWSLSGAAGRLGFPVGAQQCSGTASCQQEFQFGWILWTSAGGARSGAPAIDAAYAAAGGPTGALGARTSGLLYYPDNGGGMAEAFVGGAIYYKPSVGSAYAVTGGILTAYYASGGASGLYGWPTSAMACSAATCTQEFEGATLVSSASGAFAVTEPVRSGFTASGGVSGPWGVPVSAVGAIAQNGGGFGQAFAQGSAYYRIGGSAHLVAGAVRDHYFSLAGAAGILGFPVGAQQCSGTASCQQEFQFGWILWTSSGGARVGAPAIDAAYAAAGGPSGALGARTSQLLYYSSNGGGFAEAFVGGAIFFKPSVGTAYPVTGSVRAAYFASGGAAGAYGWPTSAMTCAAGTCTQQFEGGPISAAG